MPQKTKTKSHSAHKKSTPPLVKAYLVLYNLLSACGWSYILYLTLTHLVTPSSPPPPPSISTPAYIPPFVPQALVPLYTRATTASTAVGTPTLYVQSAALLEVLHVLLGFVRSPLGTTATQVASRLYLVWGIAPRFESARASPFFASMVLSWSVTEVIRYTFYAASLVGAEPRLLTWLRYTTFYVLYPTGAGSEAFVAFATLPLKTPLNEWDVESIGRAVLFGIWWPGLYVMYTYMMKQRRKVFGGQRTAKPKSS
ncbi:hypothetical protein HETIRDRAFT_476130 [Heterobasidion irregulare TC 32-1]|uniref:Very-long-chain (3R)-3-hydroxyacyl-CoA dehydratase n=1 Tax=Heterobasidion irregulare (strain TC 32-1) TaxID=747525 RepID=W4K426_HETIT|nr:uncharacterized protein HETIRDRAFT_476130 [Heterobasidion irregulare TC 32-1]ETW80499.1 hypothetical protein HETIRDRAFT_476130 [Heterobasidion irregulare TC 32-1]